MRDSNWFSADIISSSRLNLVPLPAAFMAASLAGDQEVAETMLGARVPEEWFQEGTRIARRLQQLERDPAQALWRTRAIVLRSRPPGDPPPVVASDEPGPVMVGQIGFHTPPGAAYLDAIAPGGVEIGYSIFTPYRRRGLAREACYALMEAARRTGVETFVLTISPDNVASTRLAQSMGFRRVGRHIDEEDGPEDIYVVSLPLGALMA